MGILTFSYVWNAMPQKIRFQRNNCFLVLGFHVESALTSFLSSTLLEFIETSGQSIRKTDVLKHNVSGIQFQKLVNTEQDYLLKTNISLNAKRDAGT